MPLEQEVPNLLVSVFIVIILLFSISTITLWVKNRMYGLAYTFILIHLILLSIGFYFFKNAITLELDYNHPMASEENSLQIGFASVFWAFSMISLLIGIFKFTSLTRK